MKKFVGEIAVFVQISRKWKKAEIDQTRYRQNSWSQFLSNKKGEPEKCVSEIDEERASEW